MALNLTISCSHHAIHSNSSLIMMQPDLPPNNTTIEDQLAPIMTNIQTLQLVPPSNSRKWCSRQGVAPAILTTLLRAVIYWTSFNSNSKFRIINKRPVEVMAKVVTILKIWIIINSFYTHKQTVLTSMLLPIVTIISIALITEAASSSTRWTMFDLANGEQKLWAEWLTETIWLKMCSWSSMEEGRPPEMTAPCIDSTRTLSGNSHSLIRNISIDVKMTIKEVLRGDPRTSLKMKTSIQVLGQKWLQLIRAHPLSARSSIITIEMAAAIAISFNKDPSLHL